MSINERYAMIEKQLEDKVQFLSGELKNFPEIAAKLDSLMANYRAISEPTKQDMQFLNGELNFFVLLLQLQYQKMSQENVTRITKGKGSKKVQIVRTNHPANPLGGTKSFIVGKPNKA